MGKTLNDVDQLTADTHAESLDSDSKIKKNSKSKKNKHRADDAAANYESNHKKRMRKHSEVEKVSNGGIEDKLSNQKKELSVVVSGKDVEDVKYVEMKSFKDAKLPDEVLECCKTFTEPSPIQSRAWPFLLNGRDFIGIAATGSGKTLAFGIPAIMHVLGKRKGKLIKKRNPLCLVLSPTRELAQQIFDVIADAGKPCNISSVCLYGGTKKGPQIADLKAGVDFVIGTPGRLKDLMEMGVCSLADVSFVVLDEADRMLDMGFEREVRSILSQTSSASYNVPAS